MPLSSPAIRRSVRFVLALLCLIIAVWIILSAGLPQRSDALGLYAIGQTPIAAEVGSLAPPIETYDLTGKRFSLNSLLGHPVIVNFWATWCGPCISEMPALQALYERQRSNGVHVIGVDIHESTADVLNWTKSLGLTYDFVVDSEGRLSYLYMLRGVPTTFLIGRDGFVKQVISGPVNMDRLEADVQSLELNTVPKK